MVLKEDKETKGFVSWALSGAGWGFVIGIVILIKINKETGYYYLFGSTLVGLFLGLLIAYLIHRKRNMNDWWEDTYRSSDLDGVQERLKKGSNEKDNSPRTSGSETARDKK